MNDLGIFVGLYPVTGIRLKIGCKYSATEAFGFSTTAHSSGGSSYGRTGRPLPPHPSIDQNLELVLASRSSLPIRHVGEYSFKFESLTFGPVPALLLSYFVKAIQRNFKMAAAAVLDIVATGK